MHSLQQAPDSSQGEPSGCFTAESVWAISVQTTRPTLPAIELAADEDEAKESWIPSWFPSAVEGVWGLVFGATVGALIVTAVALDAEDTVPQAVLHPRAAHQLVASSHRPIALLKPLSAATRASVTDDASAPRHAQASRRSLRR